MKTIQFSISIVSVLFQFCVSTASMLQTVQFQAIQFSICTQFKCQNSSVILSNSVQYKHSLIVKTVLFQAIQFSKSTQFNPIWSIDKNQLGATTQGQNGPGSDGYEAVLCIPQSSTITGTSPSDCLVSYPEHLLKETYPSAKKQSVYSTAPAYRAI